MAGGRLWTPEEDGYLIENYIKLGRKACADHLKRPINGVKRRAYTLGIQANVAWPEREDNLLIEMYPKIGRAGCAKLLPGRTIASIGVRAGFLGLTNDKRHTPTPDEIEVIRTNYFQRGGRKICAQLLPHLTLSTISYVAEKLGVLQRGRKNWTDEENQLLRLNYASKGKHWCARQLSDRTPNSIVAQARKLGLAADPNSKYFKDWQARAAASKRGRSRPDSRERLKKLWEQGRVPQPVFTAERREKHAETMRAWHARHGNPNKGKSLSDETRQKMSVASQRMWKDPEFGAKMRTPERRAKRRQTSSENWIRSGRANENAYSRCRRGRRADLGEMFFRSGWEANYARILNLLKEENEIYHWVFEPNTLPFPVDSRPFSYTPDFMVWRSDDRDHCYVEYVEIKGQMDDLSKLKHSHMEQFYPNVKIRIIEEKEYRNLEMAFSPRIEKWEFDSSRYIAKRKVA
jgi:hypothetical protein